MVQVNPSIIDEVRGKLKETSNKVTHVVLDEGSILTRLQAEVLVKMQVQSVMRVAGLSNPNAEDYDHHFETLKSIFWTTIKSFAEERWQDQGGERQTNETPSPKEVKNDAVFDEQLKKANSQKILKESLVSISVDTTSIPNRIKSVSNLYKQIKGEKFRRLISTSFKEEWSNAAHGLYRRIILLMPYAYSIESSPLSEYHLAP